MQASRRERLTNKQGPGALGAPPRSSEPKPHPHANKPALIQASSPAELIRSIQSGEKTGCRFGAPKANMGLANLTTWDVSGGN